MSPQVHIGNPPLPPHPEQFREQYGQIREIKHPSESVFGEILWEHKPTGRLFAAGHSNGAMRMMRRSQPGQWTQVIWPHDNPSAHAGHNAQRQESE